MRVRIYTLTSGWFAKLRLTNPAEIDELLSEEAYKAILEH
jgi:hypothetical protein